MVEDFGIRRVGMCLTDLDNLPGPGELAEETIENLEAGLVALVPFVHQ